MEGLRIGKSLGPCYQIDTAGQVTECLTLVADLNVVTAGSR